MKRFNFKEFHKNVQENLNAVGSLIEHIQERTYSIHYSTEENEMDRERIAELLNQIKLKIYFAYDYLGLEKMIDMIELELKDHLGKFDKIVEHYLVDFYYSPVQIILQNHINAISSHIKIESEETSEINLQIKQLERILRGTPKILMDYKIEPSNEAEVRNVIYGMLIHVFPDAVKDIPIVKVSKTYKPDIGIKKLKSAIEYKYVNSTDEAKNAIGGVFEDMKGYEGSKDWTTFYAVFYMTDHFLTQDQVEAEFKLSKVSHNWKPIVVYGKGNRKNKSDKPN